MWLVVGLGNPGSEYARTRHNVGFMVVDELMSRGRAGTPKAKFGAEIAEGTLAGEKITFCKPMEYMNLSGGAVGRAAGFWKVPPAQVLVIHDEIDLPWARLRLASGGGAGGHNGIKSVIAAIGNDFPRIRVGVGRPPSGREAAGHVLGGFSKDEQRDLPILIVEAADAAMAILEKGVTAAMNRFNAAKKPAQNG